jgi:thiamine-phosphate pyrophosphorylase
VNDRVDVALAAEADGVHLGPDDMHPRDARALLGERIVGVSVSTVEEAAALAPFASYFGVGAIYGSATKLDAGDAVGPQRITEIRAAFPHIPIVAIGGITRENLGAVARAGADAAAVVSAVVCEDDMRAATAALVRAWLSSC